MKKFLIVIAVSLGSLAAMAQSYIHATLKKDADPGKIDILFKPTYTSAIGEYVNYFQFSVAIPAAGNSDVTATAVAVNAFRNMGTLIKDGPYTEGSDMLFNFVFVNPNVPSPNNYKWASGSEFTGVVVTFSSASAALVARMVDLSNDPKGYGGVNGNSFYGIVTNTGDKTEHSSRF